MPSDTPDSPDAGEVFSAASACKPPEAEYLPSPLGGRPPHVPSDDTFQLGPASSFRPETVNLAIPEWLIEKNGHRSPDAMRAAWYDQTFRRAA